MPDYKALYEAERARNLHLSRQLLQDRAHARAVVADLQGQLKALTAAHSALLHTLAARKRKSAHTEPTSIPTSDADLVAFIQAHPDQVRVKAR